MNKEAIKKELIEKHKSFTDYISSLSDDKFVEKKNIGKWSAGQQLQHIFLSVRPVNLALYLPSFLLRFFGKPKEKRTYEEIIKTYQNSLKNGGKAGALYIPKSVSINQKQKLIIDLTNLIKTLTEKIDKLGEEDLDNYILPHPLIGKTSIREMLYFTIYHVQHHHKAIVDNSN
ncbi:MAG: DinB family protein [Bacteroidota bacterium]